MLKLVSAIGAATVRAIASREQPSARQHSLNALFSRQFGTTMLHANIGGVIDREAEPGTRQNRMTWTLAGEVLGQRGQPETAQIGLRWWALPKYIQFTSSVAAQRGAGQEGRWVSFGIRFETGDSFFWEIPQLLHPVRALGSVAPAR